MKKIIWIFVAVFLIAGTAAFAQEGGIHLMVGLGFQMNFTKPDDADWSNSAALAWGMRCYLLSLTDNLNLGFSSFFRASFPEEIYWKSPDGFTYRITNADFTFDFGMMPGASLAGTIAGPVGFALDAGPTVGWKTASFDIGDYDVFDLGLGMNAGIQFDIDEFILEAGANLGFSFFRIDSYNANNQSGSSSGVASIFKVNPYILVGVRKFF